MHRSVNTVCVAVVAFAIGFLLGICFRPILAFIIAHAVGPKVADVVFKGIITVLSFLLSGLVGYLIGAVKSFREEKQKAYGELLPPIVRMAYNPAPDDEKEFNKALNKVWLYANKEVAFKVDRVASILVDRTRGNLTKAIQQAIFAMRRDIHHKWPLAEIRPDEVKHLYMRIGGQ